MIAVAHQSAEVAERWVEELGGHLALLVDPACLPERPTVLDAVLVDPAFPASQVEALRNWAGGRVSVRLTEQVDLEWLTELVRTSSEPLRLGDRRVDLRRGVVTKGAGVVSLTDTEALLLAWLAAHAPMLVSRSDLLQRVWGYHPQMQTRVVDVTMARLRAKIEDDPSNPAFLVTVRGKGYRLDGLDRSAPIPPAAQRPADSGLIGRQDAQERLRSWLERGDPVMTVLGPPGIGKTALATAFAASVPGASYAELQAAETDVEALSVVIAALGLPPGTSEQAAVRAVSSGERALLVLDNAEHLLGFVGRLLASPPRSPVLVTSRVRLMVPEERCFDLEPLSAEATEALFLDRARRLRADFTDDPAVLGELAALCEGLPLAVELAAAQVRVLSGPDLIRVLGKGAVRNRKRIGYQSYDEALASSWALLDDEERALLAVLAALRGQVPLSLVEAVHDEPLEALGGLTDASLVRIRHGPDGAAVHLLETVRRHVLRLHPLAREAEIAVVERTARFMAALDAEARTPRAWAALQTMDQLRLTVQALVDRAIAMDRPELASTLALSMMHLFEGLGPEPASLAMLRRSDAVATGEASLHLGLMLAELLRVQGELDEAMRFVERCAEQATDAGSRAEVEVVRTVIANRRGDLDATALQAAINDLPDGVPRWRGLATLGLVHTRRLETDASINALQRSLAIADRLGVPWMQVSSLWLLASAHHAAGDSDRAAEMATQCVETRQAGGPVRNREMMLSVQLTAERGRGNVEGALVVQEQLIGLMREQGRTLHLAWMSVARGYLLLYLPDLDEARVAARTAERLYRSLDNDAGIARAGVLRGNVALARGDLDQAEALAVAGLDAVPPSHRHSAVELAVWVAIARAQTEGAREILGSVEVAVALRELLEALLDLAEGKPRHSIPEGDNDYRRALALRLGARGREPRTARGRAILEGGQGYPESLVVARLWG